mgnify:CR=1 FL=1
MTRDIGLEQADNILDRGRVDLHAFHDEEIVHPAADAAGQLTDRYDYDAFGNVLDREGVGDLMRIAVERGRGVKPELKLGICGEHGGDGRSVAFCHELGLDPTPETRALEAVLLAHRGERRKSMLVIRDAFPALGGPFQATLPMEARRIYYPLDYQEAVRSWARANIRIVAIPVQFRTVGAIDAPAHCAEI